MNLFDSKAYTLHQQRAKKTFDAHRFLFDHVGSELIERIQDIKKNFSSVLNLSPHPLPHLSHHHPFLEDCLPFPEANFDLIVSCLQLHWVNHLPNLLQSLRLCLQPGGLFVGAFWGGQTLFELRESLLQAELNLKGGASPRLAPLIHPSDAPLLLGKAGFAEPVVDRETITVTYPSLLRLMKDLRGMGETNNLMDRPKTFTPRIVFEKAEEIYCNTYGDLNHALPATFEVIYMTGWK